MQKPSGRHWNRPKGQLEAGLCAGLSYLQTIFRIVLPRRCVPHPPLSNSLISMVKDTSLAANITVTEMFMVTSESLPVPTSRFFCISKSV
ncbi:MAG: hypothetical protein ACLURV_08625 [Gallintestinimicrobium sp.]